MDARSSKGSLVADNADYASAAASSSHTPSGTLPPSSVDLGSHELHSVQSHESLKNESPDSYIDYGGHRPFHSEGNTSVHSAFADTAPADRSTMTPLLPAHALVSERNRELNLALPITSDNPTTSAEEAQQAWKVLMKFMEERRAGFDVQDFVQLGKLGEKLKAQYI